MGAWRVGAFGLLGSVLRTVGALAMQVDAEGLLGDSSVLAAIRISAISRRRRG